jgi:hypothetical protein
LRFNNSVPTLQGVVAGNPALHRQITGALA